MPPFVGGVLVHSLLVTWDSGEFGSGSGITASGPGVEGGERETLRGPVFGTIAVAGAFLDLKHLLGVGEGESDSLPESGTKSLSLSDTRFLFVTACDIPGAGGPRL